MSEKSIAKHLLDIKAVFLRPNEPFTWASGIKSPIYCDNRLTLSYPDTRKKVEEGLAQIIKTPSWASNSRSRITTSPTSLKALPSIIISPTGTSPITPTYLPFSILAISPLSKIITLSSV